MDGSYTVIVLWSIRWCHGVAPHLTYCLHSAVMCKRMWWQKSVFRFRKRWSVSHDVLTQLQQSCPHSVEKRLSSTCFVLLFIVNTPLPALETCRKRHWNDQSHLLLLSRVSPSNMQLIFWNSPNMTKHFNIRWLQGCHKTGRSIKSECGPETSEPLTSPSTLMSSLFNHNFRTKQ